MIIIIIIIIIIIVIIIIIINCHLYFGRRRILIPESSEKIPSSRVELNSQPSEF